MALLHTVAITRFRGRCAVESLSPASGPDDLPNGWVHVLGEGVADDVVGTTVIAGLNESDRPLPEAPVEPAAANLGVDRDAQLAEPGAARVLAEYDGTAILIFGLRNAGRDEGFIPDEDIDEREILAAESAQTLGLAVRLALDEVAG